MKIVVFKGGLGNQMFQYVLYEYLKKSNNYVGGYYGRKELFDHNGLEISNVFHNIILPKGGLPIKAAVFIYKALNKFPVFSKIIQNDNLNTDKIVLDGYWQDLKFFGTDTQEIFDFKLDLDQKNLKTLDSIKNYNSISVHIRRGDYLANSDIYGGICDMEYYKKAIEYFDNKNFNNLFVFFSDDISWVRENFKMDNALYIDHNKGKNSYVDMYLMSKCNHNIIANSTFSWWGAYLNKNRGKTVIMPAKWSNAENDTANLFMQDWLKF